MSEDVLNLQDVLKCDLNELFSPLINLGKFEWLLHCDYKLSIKDSGRIPELTSKKEKIEFTNTLINLVNQLDKHIIDNIKSIERMALPKTAFHFPNPALKLPTDEVPGPSPKILAMIDYSIHIQKKSDYTFSQKKTMTVEFQ